MKAIDLSRASGVIPSAISKYRKGDHTWLALSDLINLAGSISEDRREQAELVRAHLLDECKGPGSELIKISISDTDALQETTPHDSIRLAPNVERAFEILRASAKRDQAVRDVVVDLAELVNRDHVAGDRGRKREPHIEIDPETSKAMYQAADALTDEMGKQDKPTKPTAAPSAPVSYGPKSRRTRGAPGG